MYHHLGGIQHLAAQSTLGSEDDFIYFVLWDLKEGTVANISTQFSFISNKRENILARSIGLQFLMAKLAPLFVSVVYNAKLK